MSKTRILLTGAAGGIGSAFFRAAAADYTFRLADREISALAGKVSQDHEVCLFDVADLNACQQACQDIEVVVHLAANANPDAEFYSALLDNNIQGTYNIFRAAKDQGCQRVIFASSAQVVIGYAPDVQAHLESPLRPMNMYGVSKCFGEAVASYFGGYRVLLFALGHTMCRTARPIGCERGPIFSICVDTSVNAI